MQWLKSSSWNNYLYRLLFRAAFCVQLFLIVTPATVHAEESLVPPHSRISDNETRITLAGLLALRDDSAALVEANALIVHVRDQEPGNLAAAAAHVPLLLKLSKQEQALDLAQNLVAREPESRSFLLLLADVQAELGHYAACRDLYRSALATSPQDAALRLRYADRCNLWGDFNEAEGIFRSLLLDEPENHPLRLRLARVLYSQQRHEESSSLIKGILLQAGLEDQRLQRECILLLKDIRLMQKDYASALAIIEDALKQDHEFHEAFLAKAEVMLLDKRPRQAADTLHALLDQGADAESVLALLYLGRALLALEDVEGARNALLRAKELALRPVQARFYLTIADGRGMEEDWTSAATAADLHTWGQTCAEEGMIEESIRWFELALEKDATFFPARIALVQSLATASRYTDALELLRLLREEHPESEKLLLTEARILAWDKQYDAGLRRYEELHRRNPQDPVPRKEAARTAYWGKMRTLGGAWFSSIHTPAVDKRLTHTLPRIPAIVLPEAPTHDSHSGVRPPEAPPYRAYEALLFMLPSLDGDLQQQATEAILEYEALYQLQKATWLEHQAKDQLWNRRPIRGMQKLVELLEFQPGNEEALFDLAQAQCALNLCNEERETYERLLHLSPMHSLAGYALKRREIRSGHALHSRFSVWDEEGHGELGQITRLHSELRYELPLTCQSRLTTAAHNFMELPRKSGQPRHAYGQSLGVESVFNEHLSFSVSIMGKWYDGSPDNSITGRLGFWLRTNDHVRLGLLFNRKEEFANDFALEQGVISNRPGLALEAVPWRWLELKFGYEHIFYSDDNQGLLAEGEAKFLLSDHPRTLSLAFNLEHRNTQNQSDYIYSGSYLTNIIHPYWTPRDYVATSATLQWRHDLSEFFFCGSQLHYYDIKTTMGYDSENNPYYRGALAWHWEFLEHWTMDIEFMIHHSEQWKARSMSAGLSYRF